MHKGEELMRHLQEKSNGDEQQSASSAASDAKITLFKNGFLLGAEDAGGEFYDLSGFCCAHSSDERVIALQ